jgi:RNA polymerase sigma-70 factor (ECF subfamily)
MASPQTTCWSVIEAAAAGAAGERQEFARRYGPVVRAYLAARWRASPCRQDLEDAVQEVFVECFKEGGVLARADRGRGEFRPFLYGVARNVALRLERARARAREQQTPDGVDLDGVPAAEEQLSRAFDRAWAKAVLREAARRQEQRADAEGDAARKRVELLRLRFHEGLPIREIARRWGADAAALHHEYARARQEFKAALLEVVAFHHPGAPAEVECACAELLAHLG